MCSSRVRYIWASDLGVRNTQSIYQESKWFSLLNLHTRVFSWLQRSPILICLLNTNKLKSLLGTYSQWIWRWRIVCKFTICAKKSGKCFWYELKHMPQCARLRCIMSKPSRESFLRGSMQTCFSSKWDPASWARGQHFSEDCPFPWSSSETVSLLHKCN